MTARSRRGSHDVIALMLGGAVGAAVRLLLHEIWSTPAATVLSTVVSILLGFGLVGYTLATSAAGVIRAFLAGAAGALASIGGYIAIGIGDAPWTAGVVIILGPAAVVAGLWCGGTVGVALGAGRRQPVGERRA